MSNFFYDFMSEEERESELKSMQDINDLKRIQYAAESAVMAHEVRISDIETKALLENYSDEELGEAYSRELEIYTEGVQELLQKLVTKLKNIWYSITGQTDKIVGAKINSDEKIEVPYNPSKVHQALIHVGDTIKNLTSLKKKDEATGKEKINWTGVLVDTAVGAATGTGLIYAIKKHNENMNAIKTEGAVTINAKEAPGWIQKIDDATKKMIANVEKHKAAKDAGEEVSIMSSISSSIQSIAAAVLKAIATALRKIGGFEADPGDEKNDETQITVLSNEDNKWYDKHKKECMKRLQEARKKYAIEQKDDGTVIKGFIDPSKGPKKGKALQYSDYYTTYKLMDHNRSALDNDDKKRLGMYKQFLDFMKQKTGGRVTTESTFLENGELSSITVYETTYLEDGSEQTISTKYIYAENSTYDDYDEVDSLYESYENELTSLNDLIDLL